MSAIGHNSDSGAGFYLAGRDMRFHPVVGCGKPMKPADPSQGAWSKFEAWHDLIALARHKEGKVEDKGYARTLQAGQLLGGQDFLSKRWNWTRQTVRTFLAKLERECMIAIFCSKKPNQRKGNLTNLISVTKYVPYQFERGWSNQRANQPTTSEQPASNQPATTPNQLETIKQNTPSKRARRVAPHMNGVGFVISKEAGCSIDQPHIDKWRQIFPNIPDLEAQLKSMAVNFMGSSTAFARFRDFPELWFEKILAEENAKGKIKSLADEMRELEKQGAKQ